MRQFSVRPILTLNGRTFKVLRGWSGKPLHLHSPTSRLSATPSQPPST